MKNGRSNHGMQGFYVNHPHTEFGFDAWRSRDVAIENRRGTEELREFVRDDVPMICPPGEALFH